MLFLLLWNIKKLTLFKLILQTATLIKLLVISRREKKDKVRREGAIEGEIVGCSCYRRDMGKT